MTFRLNALNYWFRVLVRRRLAVLALLTMTLLGAELPAQRGLFGGRDEIAAYWNGRAELTARARALIIEINNIRISETYCSPKPRNDVASALRSVRDRLDKLKNDYGSFRFRTRRLAQGKAVAEQWEAVKMDPLRDDFWDAAAEEIVGHAQADLDLKQKAWAASQVVDCSRTQRPAIAVQTPVAPPPPATNPLAGLKRPAVPPHAPVPDLPPPFCTYRELWAWHDANILPQMTVYLDAGWEIMKYTQALTDAGTSARDAGDKAGSSAVSGELDWAVQAHRANEQNWLELARFRDRLTVKPCPPKTDPEPPKAAVETDKDKETGMNWHLGAGVEYAGYPDFKKVVGDQYSSTGVTGSTGTTGLGVSIGFDTRRWGCKLGAHFNTLDYEQTYNAPEVNYSVKSTATLKGQFYDLSCGPRVKIGKVSVGGSFGGTYAMNKLELLDAFINGSTFSTLRYLRNWKTNVGVSVDIPVEQRLGIRLEVTKTLGGWSRDADHNNRVGVGLRYRFDGLPIF